ncbi:hypothetical protein V6N13_010987 [Hibiscus sabdariffa]|uniref:Uncharacterized protein n=1 Tax=Hibiscus sabdariffa TaxID=183260 RepID=A0ABR2SB08_9ROSI
MMGMGLDLERHGVKLPEDMRTMVLIECLPESWNDVVTSITFDLGFDEDLLGFDNVSKRLQNVGHWKQLKRARHDGESSSRDGSGFWIPRSLMMDKQKQWAKDNCSFFALQVAELVI